jgi:hypothetical protein
LSHLAVQISTHPARLACLSGHLSRLKVDFKPSFPSISPFFQLFNIFFHFLKDLPSSCVFIYRKQYSQTTMTTKQLNKLTMYLAVEGICDASPTIWQSLQAFADAYTGLKTHVTNIQTFSQSQTQDTSGIAQDKKQARLAMCSVALPIAKAVHAYALKSQNNTLAASVDFSMSDLMGGRDVQSRDNCQNISDIANTNLANLANYGVTAAQLTALTNAIAAFNLLISKPRDTRAQGKTITGNLQTEFEAADETLGVMDDLLGQLSDAQFVSDYRNARIIVDTSASHASPSPSPAPQTPPPAK